MLAITDTGAGMSEAVKARLFEPFFTTKDVGKGTGLGLATCHGIIKQSGGHISAIANRAGAPHSKSISQGAVGRQAPLPPLKAPGLPRGTETILLVEDDPALREMAADLAGAARLHRLDRRQRPGSLNMTNQHATGHIDLLFTDVVMPHMSGKELSDRMQALYPTTKILFTSAYTENAIVHQGVLNPGIASCKSPSRQPPSPVKCGKCWINRPFRDRATPARQPPPKPQMRRTPHSADRASPLTVTCMSTETMSQAVETPVWQ